MATIKSKNKMGRPPKRTPETLKRIVKALLMGATYELACKYAGVTYSAFRQWAQAADENDPDFVEFFEAIRKAEGEAAYKWLQKIEKSTAKDWTAAAWKLERRYPHDYGRHVQEITGKDGGPVEVLKVYKEIDLDKV